jgi:hypothetical protein
MNPDEGLKLLESLILVTPQRVSIAKAFILQHFVSDTARLVQTLLQANEAIVPDQVVIHQSVDTEGTIRKAAEGLSWTLAGCEAIWGLISAGLLIPASYDLHGLIRNLGWTTVVPGSGGHSSGWQLEHLSLPIPRRVLLPRSLTNREQQPLSDPDLFLHSLNIPNIHQEVEESLREAVRCFRQEIYLGCLAMLGKASEGAWVELGLKLAKAVPSGAPVDGEKTKTRLEDPNVGIGKKIMDTLRLYERTDVFGAVHKTSGVTIQDLRNAVVWADAVRESRNSVHYGVQPSMPNTYEKVAALLIGAVPHLRLLYRIDTALDETVKAQQSPPA